MHVAKFLKVRGVVRLLPPHIDQLVSWIAAQDFCHHFARSTEYAAGFQQPPDMPLRVGQRTHSATGVVGFAGRTAERPASVPCLSGIWDPACSLYVGRT